MSWSSLYRKLLASNHFSFQRYGRFKGKMHEKSLELVFGLQESAPSSCTHTLLHTHPCMAHSDPCCPAIVAATLPSPATAGAAPAEKRAVHATHSVMMNQTFFLVAQLGIFFSLLVRTIMSVLSPPTIH